jgi:hypothetical protein
MLTYCSSSPGGSLLSLEKNGPAPQKNFGDVLFLYFTRINHTLSNFGQEGILSGPKFSARTMAFKGQLS